MALQLLCACVRACVRGCARAPARTGWVVAQLNPIPKLLLHREWGALQAVAEGGDCGCGLEALSATSR